MLNHLFNLKKLAVAALVLATAFQAEARHNGDRNDNVVGEIIEDVIRDSIRGDRRDRRPGHHDDYNHGYMDRRKAMEITRLLYRAILFRQGEPQGVYDNANAIMDNGVPYVAAAIASSPEFYQNIHRRYRAETIVDNVYRVLLGRSRDWASQGWVDLVREGRADEALYGITDSPEFRQRHGIY